MKGLMGEITLMGEALELVARYGAVVAYADANARKMNVLLQVVDLWPEHVRLGFRRGRIMQNVAIARVHVGFRTVLGTEDDVHWKRMVDTAIDQVFAASQGDAGPPL